MKELFKSYLPIFVQRNLVQLKSMLQKIIYRGSKVRCNICKLSYETFAPYGDPPRFNAKCPNCGSLERHRLILRYLKEKTTFFKNNKKNIRVLHFAPEEFFYNSFSNHANIDYFPCDLFPDIFSFDKKKIIRKVDILSIPYEDNYFDYILCNHVLEHIVEDRIAMSELYRVMNNGGLGIFQVPIDYNLDLTYEDSSITTEKDRKKAFGQKDHVRWYGKDYKMRLSQIGFTVNEDQFINTLKKDEIFRNGFSDNELIYCCTK